MKKIVGIIGGMGPEATANLFKSIIINTKANKDQDHIHIVIDNNTNIQDRSDYILRNVNNPKEELINTALKLEEYGVDIIAIPCNTAHYFYEDIKKSTNIPIINMIEETAKFIKMNNLDKNIILLSTEGTYSSNIYDKVFRKFNIDIKNPMNKDKKIIMKAIYNFKSSQQFNISLFKETLNKIKEKKESVFILGCTELSVIFKENNLSYNYIDPTEILAKIVIVKSGYELKNKEEL